MYSALLFKEWLKTRRVFFVALIVSLLVADYVILTMNSHISANGVNILWLGMILKDSSFVDPVKYLPLIIGMALGIAQMAPEMSHKRLKLTLHLPYPHSRLVSLMLATGTIQLLVIFVLQAIVIAVYDATILPGEMVWRVLLTMLPWYLAGICAYLCVSAVCLEGTWYTRVILSLLGIALIMVMFLQPGVMAAYNSMIIVIIILILILAVLSFGSIARFKEGLQD